MVAYPVRGLDINSSYMIYNLINKQKEKGSAVFRRHHGDPAHLLDHDLGLPDILGQGAC